MWWTIGKRVLGVLGILWMTAVGGILGANLLGIIGTQFFATENKDLYVMPWSHAGWYLGTILFFLGAVTGRLRFINGTSLGSSSGGTADESTAQEEKAVAALKAEQVKETSGVLGSAFAGGLAGGVLGLLLGANLLTFWFSLAYSPFAPQQVVSSVEVVHESQPAGSVFKRPIMRSSHPIALYLCLTPVALGVVGGATAAGVIALKYQGETAS
ncbi:hypothetical protein LOC68_07660 [Blastopirellula sp. JC732]|uniref:Uncharacterized protein n=1 Tax=Blastopirellula sediminis TaxID=2894196 RepID=A0A9X1MLU3_9BACT|nr:hypothetical protein [Blastopirellula sediminis]MCC9608956.1 hypothetical protein [Blastopirellula sediminis]MCC9628267.1 hypothetical protein [Blastopirellula sediminis]